MKSKNMVIAGYSDERLKQLEEDYNFCGRDTILKPGSLTVLALPKKRKPRKPRPSRFNE